MVDKTSTKEEIMDGLIKVAQGLINEDYPHRLTISITPGKSGEPPKYNIKFQSYDTATWRDFTYSENGHLKGKQDGQPQPSLYEAVDTETGEVLRDKLARGLGEGNSMEIIAPDGQSVKIEGK